jgi:hypothetical protein
MQLSAENESLRTQLAHVRMQTARVDSVSTLHTCIVCFDDEVPAERGVACCGPNAHFTCSGCLERIVIDAATQIDEMNELASQAAAAEAEGDRRRSWFLAGHVCCPSRMPNCPSEPYADGVVAQHISEEAFQEHMRSRMLLPIAREAQKVFERAQETMRAEVERIRAQVRASLEVEQGHALLAVQLRQQMPNARQCRRCGFGPVDHMACADLQAHQGQQVGNAQINNACPQCGWFSHNIGDWLAWDGRLPQEANERLRNAGTQWRQDLERELEEAEARLQREQQEAAARPFREQQQEAGLQQEVAAGEVEVLILRRDEEEEAAWRQREHSSFIKAYLALVLVALILTFMLVLFLVLVVGGKNNKEDKAEWQQGEQKGDKFSSGAWPWVLALFLLAYPSLARAASDSPEWGWDCSDGLDTPEWGWDCSDDCKCDNCMELWCTDDGECRDCCRCDDCDRD